MMSCISHRATNLKIALLVSHRTQYRSCQHQNIFGKKRGFSRKIVTTNQLVYKNNITAVYRPFGYKQTDAYSVFSIIVYLHISNNNKKPQNDLNN